MNRSLYTGIVLGLVLQLMTSSQIFATDDTTEKLKTPVIITTCGQSPGALMLKMIAKRAGVEATHNDTLSAKDIQGKPYKTLIITTGTSLKGMGAAGTDINAEIGRIKKLIAQAKTQKISIVCAHIEGMARRVDSSDASSIQAVSDMAQAYIIIQDSDSDGYFTRQSKEKKVPLYSAKEALNLIAKFKEIFEVN